MNKLASKNHAHMNTRTIFSWALMPLVGIAGKCFGNPVNEKHPNIILFLVDDMGWQDTSEPFWDSITPLNKIYHTPNMERLARQGVKFTNANACPVSSPSRVSLMTGANVAQHQVSNWTLNKDKPTDSPNKLLSFQKWNYNGISPTPGDKNAFYAKCLPQILSENGYLTCIVGKAHFGALNTSAENPLAIGFDLNIAGHAAGAMGSYLGEENYGNKTKGGYTPPWGVPDLEAYHGTDIFLTEALTREASKLIDTALAGQKPFFLYMSHYAVHAPFAADKRYYQKYIDKGMTPTEARYATLLEGMDKSLGDLMDLVEKRGIADNTIIIFMSDNGGYSVGRGGEAAQRNYPLRGGKGACYEGGIREPMIVYWPGITQANTVNATPVIIEDFYPSILEMAGIKKYKTPQHIDGISFVKNLKKGKGNPDRPLYFHYPNNWGERQEDVGIPQSAIKKGRWKLVHNYEDGKNQLYDLQTDISEKHDLAGQAEYQKITATLAKELSDFLRKNNANLPVWKSNGNPCAYPDGKE